MKKEQWKEKIKEIIIKNRNSASKNKYLDTLSEITQLREGKIKEGEEYVNNTTKMTFIDSLGNEFKMSPSKVKSGSWSPIESGYISHSVDYYMKQLEDIALSKGGRIKKGEFYTNNKTKMTFIDKNGYEFQMSPDGVKSGQWSPYEAGKLLS